MAFVLSNPTGDLARTSRSEIIRIVSALLRKNTDLDADVVDPSLLKECKGRLTCLALKVRRDYQRSALALGSNRYLPFREHVRRLRKAGVDYARFLLVVSNITAPGQADRISAVMVDTDIALQLYHDASRTRPDWASEVEVRINNGAVVAEPVRRQVQTTAETEAYLTDLFEKHFRRALEETRHWQPYGDLVLECPSPGLAVEVDGTPLGTTQAGTTHVVGLRPGAHTIALNHPDYAPAKAVVTVQRQQTARISLDPERTAGSKDGLRLALIWTGAAVAAAGAGVLTYGVTTQDADLTVTCIENTCPSSNRFITFDYDPAQADEMPLGINPSGIMIAPLGYSLIGTGAAWSLGALLTGEDDIPWIALVAGAVVGGLSYGLSAALN